MARIHVVGMHIVVISKGPILHCSNQMIIRELVAIVREGYIRQNMSDAATPYLEWVIIQFGQDTEVPRCHSCWICRLEECACDKVGEPRQISTSHQSIHPDHRRP